jgi:hypothetical protein
MTPLETALRGLKRDLRRLGVRWALVGGMAVATYGSGRSTMDVDAAASVGSDTEAERLVNRLSGLGYQVATLIERKDQQRLAGVRLRPPSGPETLRVDILVAASGIEPEIVAAAQERTIRSGLTLPVAALGHLIAMKLVSVSDYRATDHQDILYLLGQADPTDIDLCRGGIALIT